MKWWDWYSVDKRRALRASICFERPPIEAKLVREGRAIVTGGFSSTTKARGARVGFDLVGPELQGSAESVVSSMIVDSVILYAGTECSSLISRGTFFATIFSIRKARFTPLYSIALRIRPSEIYFVSTTYT